jgi:signal transduction histidine kinase
MRMSLRGPWLDGTIMAVAASITAASIALGVPSSNPAAQWVLAEAAALGLGLIRRAPVAAFAVEVVLIFVTDAVVPAGSHVAPLTAAVALGAVAYRHRWPVTLAALAAMYAATLASVASDDGDLLAGADGVVRILSVGLATAAPVAFGRYLAVLRQAATVAEERARDAEERRVVETRTARLAERARIASDLHDLVAHHVSAIAMQAGSARYAATHGPDPAHRLSTAVGALESIHTSAGQALVDLRGLLRVLRDPADHDSLADPEEMIADAVRRSRSAGLEIRARIDDRAAEVPLTLRVTAARVVQEALTNALKHAGPGTEVDATVAIDDSQLQIEVANSVPAGRAPALPRSGHGLAGMRERVEILGGTLAAGPTHTGGWRLHVALPIGARS